MSLYLQELGPKAVSHRQELEEVKRQLDIDYDELDCWLYGFLENKKFDIPETVAKLQRRFQVEASELARHDITDYMRASLRSGVIQCVGEDKCGRALFYVTVRRDKPVAERREEKKRAFDMLVSYGTRLRTGNMKCKMALLVNYENASLWNNVDMSLQADVAVRLSKYFPGSVSKIYVCNMSRILSTVAKPLFSQLPAALSECFVFLSKSDRDAGKLLEFIDESVLPVSLGGTNDCDHETQWVRNAEAVEEYYEELKEAVLCNGLTVKQWELQKVRRHSPAGSFVSTGTDADFVTSLKTCGSFSALASTEAHLYESFIAPSRTVFLEKENEWLFLMQCFPRHLALLFLEELHRWRVAVAEEETADRYALLDNYIEICKLESDELPTINLENRKWYKMIPKPLCAFHRVFLIGITFSVAVSFLLALIFVLSLTSTVASLLFMGLFVEWSYVFPLGGTLLLASLHSTSLCSFSLDVLSALAKRNVIPPLDLLGRHRGSIAQIIIFAIIVCIQIVVFTFFLVLESFAVALQASTATGALITAFLLCVSHILFYFDWLGGLRRPGREQHSSLVTLYLLLNTQEKEEGAGTVHSMGISFFIVCTVPILLSLLCGVGFLISGSLVFAVATGATSTGAVFALYYCSDRHPCITSCDVLRYSLLLACMAWLFGSYAFGFWEYSIQWGVPVFTLTAVTALSVCLSIVCMVKKEANVLLRLFFVLFCAVIAGSCISNFILVNKGMGFFSFALLVHLALGTVFVRYNSRNIGGVCLFLTTFSFVTTSCIMLGWYGTNLGYTVPRSIPSDEPSHLDNYSQDYHRYPVCSMRVAGGFSIPDLALLTELADAQSSEVFDIDFNNWFGNSDVTFLGVSKRFSSGREPWSVSRFNSVQNNITVLTLRNGYVSSSIMAMTLWVGSMSSSPLRIFFPLDWLAKIVPLVSFLASKINFRWAHVQTQLTEYLGRVKNTTSGQVVLTAYGAAGGIASLAGTESRTKTVVFGSPGLMHVLGLMGMKREVYYRYTLAVVPDSGFLRGVGEHDPTMLQRLRCEASVSDCLSMGHISLELLSNCDAGNRTHT
ncbi:hypothetical protein TRVL_05465 [Trypanosoma vivax]|nr:hypothetical protein TRVL_05465 [Trypanosoma vivax]